MPTQWIYYQFISLHVDKCFFTVQVFISVGELGKHKVELFRAHFHSHPVSLLHHYRYHCEVVVLMNLQLDLLNHDDHQIRHQGLLQNAG